MTVEIEHSFIENSACREEYKTVSECSISKDMENVIALPCANISKNFYKRKLNVYNLTVHAFSTRKGYCCVWLEDQFDRAGNDIASAMMVLLEKVVADHPEAAKIILWTDSCVPQKRNSLLSFTILKYKTKFSEEYTTSSVLPSQNRLRCDRNRNVVLDCLPDLLPSTARHFLSKEKVKDLRSMLSFVCAIVFSLVPQVLRMVL
ncbi:hypothetical protein CAPTEDRAFT_197894 [Capitella teleta]|uniref:Uncharacterized protein n=1 Tax=Capitella teleta TaxID=283909 RepID=R7UCI0_CAPTE|nr:hypothetical protein CAPTEDRAFT_197894 [Capitella teleta]|eukprot:ELU01483.1 hypothetical protein CAPTEDRAFT_197894 [Capitella teleta]